MSNKKYIGMEISKTNNMLRRSFERSDYKKAADEATGKNGWIIGFLYRNQDRNIYQKDIEKNFSMRRSTVSEIIKLMEKKGFITRESVPHDARLKKLRLTPKAEEIHKFMTESLEQNEKLLRDGISEEELNIFFNVLKKIRNNIEIGDDENDKTACEKHKGV